MRLPIFCSIVGLLLLSIHPLQAQEQIGLRLENYAGINSVVLNPSWQSTNPLNWDLNLAEASVFTDNNYAYIEKSNVLHTARNAEHIRLPDDDSPMRPEDLHVHFFDNQRKKYVSIFNGVMGPSLSVRVRDYNQIGFFTKVRVAASTQKIPATLNYDYLLERADGEPFEISPAQFGAMAWSEFGLSYARKIETYTGHITLGVNAKFLTGYEAAYAKNNTTFSAAQGASDTIIINTPNVSFGFTNSNIEGDTFRRSRNGNGFGFDIGATYVYEGNEENYKLKIGASIIDIGHINFQRNTGDYLLSFDDIEQIAGADYDGYDDIDEFLAAVSNDIYDNPDELRRGNSFKMGLPTAFSLQGDYMVMEMFYVSGLLVQSLPASKIRVERGNLLAVVPRFEHRWFAASLPISLYNYQHLDIGLNMRLAFLTLGSDNLGSLIGKSKKFTGTDFYVALKINPFDLGWNLGGGGGGGGGRRGGVKCYDF